jgi:polar amino acid transport system substrate-binding protein
MELGYPPFEMRDASGQPAGVSVDLAKALGEQLKRPVQIENLPFDGLIPSLKTGKIDLILSSMTATEERARVLDFSEPYLRTGLCLLVGTKSTVQSPADAHTIVVKKGTTGHLYATKNLRGAKVLVLDKELACVLEVTQGKADAFIYDQMSVFSHWQRNRDTTRALLKPFQEESWAVGLPKGSPLRGPINEFFAKYRADGGFERLGDKWLAEQKAEFKKLGIPFFF